MTQAPLFRRSPRSDVPSPEGLVPFEKITLLQDDPDYVNDNKQTVLDKFKDLLVNS
jgi:iron(III) transport system substrate-binding protein